jgi:metal-sulfur cluster biosynthetic enzyme
MTGELRFDYAGDPALEPRITAALKRVIDPEMALDVVELGLVYGVEAGPKEARVRVTMTSAACPVTEYIVDEIAHELRSELGEGVMVHVALVWDPPWSPERMSARARSAMGWD